MFACDYFVDVGDFRCGRGALIVLVYHVLSAAHAALRTASAGDGARDRRMCTL